MLVVYNEIMKAMWNNEIIAEADKYDLIRIEGNWYFPPRSLHWEFFTQSNHRTECIWKGTANYYSLVVNGKENKDAAWYYPEPKAGSVERVKRDFSNFVAFWHGVEIVE